MKAHVLQSSCEQIPTFNRGERLKRKRLSKLTSDRKESFAELNCKDLKIGAFAESGQGVLEEKNKVQLDLRRHRGNKNVKITAIKLYLAGRLSGDYYALVLQKAKNRHS